ncbi:hypothetical protein Ciccas_001148 [Cichlidogyrus casuarinus]|uniref:Uncharacterized protein n=1 Tax=Cichlidogyrus casuarinus TaxID=1844966 RepID=A0ABD2QL64_9PLAT
MNEVSSDEDGAFVEDVSVVLATPTKSSFVDYSNSYIKLEQDKAQAESFGRMSPNSEAKMEIVNFKI